MAIKFRKTTTDPLLRLKAAELELGRMKKRQDSHKKQINTWVSYILIPYFITIYLCLIPIQILLPNLGKQLTAKYLKYYFRYYFWVRGVHHYASKDLPIEVTDPPIVILTTRQHPYAQLWVQSLFKIPLIIPLEKGFKKFKAIHFLPLYFIGKQFKHISYEDSSLDLNIDTINTLIKAGYPVVVHINHKYINPVYSPTIYYPEKLAKFIQDTPNLYFLNLDGIENYKFATFLNPVLIRTDLVPKEDLFKYIDPSDKRLLLQQVTEFFGFDDFTVCKTIQQSEP